MTLSRKLRSGQHEFTQYREALKSKGAGRRPRVISIPTVRDRIVLRALADVLGAVYPDTKGAIPQEKINYVKNMVEQNRYDTYIRLDVKEFYPSISHDRVMLRVGRRIKKPEIVDLILKAIRTPTVPDRAPKRRAVELGVPQGLAVSNILAELVARPIDRSAERDGRFFYVRYVDDVLILCKEADAVDIARSVIDLFDEEGLTIHNLGESGGKSQTGSIVDGFDYLGYLFNANGLSARKSSVHNVESALARAFTRYAKTAHSGHVNVPLARCHWKVNLIVTGCVYNGVARGWLHYFRQMDDLTLIKRLDLTVDGFVKRFSMPESFVSKRFMRAYWEIRAGKFRTNADAYIPNFDLASIRDMRSVLAQVVGHKEVGRLSDVQVKINFDRFVGKMVAELEEDIGFVS
ncbi:reverse transcriptase domain-containing protein [Amycolatopsis magusensis]|uniref:reverse transcriptase domain-containing protein n=1 Tax=Amycolatopsis magusensis TaxID=882444 RepID=UPI003C2F6D80